MKHLFTIGLTILLNLALPGLSFSGQVVFKQHEIREDGNEALLTIGIETTESVNVSVTGVDASPNSLYIPADTSQVIRISITGQTGEGYIRFIGQDEVTLAEFRVQRECSLDESCLREFLGALTETALQTIYPDDISLQIACTGCGAFATTSIVLGSFDTVCTVSSAGVCAPSFTILVPFLALTASSCSLCFADRARAIVECSNHATSLITNMDCTECSVHVVPPAPSAGAPGPPINLVVVQ